MRTDPAKIDQVTAVLAATANPQLSEEVEVAKPTDALEAEEGQTTPSPPSYSGWLRDLRYRVFTVSRCLPSFRSG